MYQRRRLAQRVGRHRVGRVTGRRRRVVEGDRGTGGGLQHVAASPQQPLPGGAGPVGIGSSASGSPHSRSASAQSCAASVAWPARSARRARWANPEELGDVHRARPQRVAADPGHDGLGNADRPPGAGDEHREVRDGIGGLVVGPQRLGQNLVRHEVRAAHRQHPQQSADLAAAERRGRHLLAVAAHLEPPQQLQGHVGHGAIVLARRRTASNPQSRVPTVVPTTWRRPDDHHPPRLRGPGLATPSETRAFPNGRLDLLRIGGGEIGRLTLEPGWRWSEHVKPIAGTDWCEAPHFQYHVAGVLRIRTSTARSSTLAPAR